MKGIVVTISRQQNNALQWTWQDQQYLPRLMNYLKVTYPAYEWEIVPGYDLKKLISPFIKLPHCPQSQSDLPKH